MLIQNSHAGNSTEEQPQTRRAVIGYAHGHGHAAHPEERLKRVHGKKAIHGQVNRTEENHNGSKQLGETPAAQFADHPRGEQNLGRGRERREKTQGEQRISQEASCEPEDRRDERGVIDIAPGQMLAAGGIIQLVTKIAVATGG